MCYRYAVLRGLNTFATAIRKWAKPLTAFPTSRFQTPDWQLQCRSVLWDIYSHLCLTGMAVKTTLLESGPWSFSLPCLPPWGGLPDVSATELGANIVSGILIETCVHLVAEKLTAHVGFCLFVHQGSFDILLADWPQHSCLVLYLQTEHVLWSFAHAPITVRTVSPILRSSAACLFLFLISTIDYFISTDCDNS